MKDLNESKTYNKYFLNGSSLIESVIAITIIATCLLIAIRLYAMVLSSSDSLRSYKIKFKVAQLYNEARIAQDFGDELYDYKTFSIRKTVEEYEGNKELKQLKYTVINSEDTLVYNYLLLKKRLNE